jgi:AcrR family transcriptional regulator
VDDIGRGAPAEGLAGPVVEGPRPDSAKIGSGVLRQVGAFGEVLTQQKESQMPRTGRRPGTAGTRAAILAAARDAFAARGYDGVSIRWVASAAAVDPALVHHYFGGKVELFRTALRTAVDPEGLLSDLFAGDVTTLGGRMVARFLDVWEGGAGANASALLRTAVTGGSTADLVREAVLPAVAGELVTRLGVIGWRLACVPP